MTTDNVVTRIVEACSAARTTPEEVAALAGVSVHSILNDPSPSELDMISAVLNIEFEDLAVRS